jgi:hypothetical protein
MVKGNRNHNTSTPPDSVELVDYTQPFDVARIKHNDLEPHHCRYPVGDPATPAFGFCGETKFPGLPYCETHANRCRPGATVRLRAQRPHTKTLETTPCLVD